MRILSAHPTRQRRKHNKPTRDDVRARPNRSTDDPFDVCAVWPGALARSCVLLPRVCPAVDVGLASNQMISFVLILQHNYPNIQYGGDGSRSACVLTPLYLLTHREMERDCEGERHENGTLFLSVCAGTLLRRVRCYTINAPTHTVVFEFSLLQSFDRKLMQTFQNSLLDYCSVHALFTPNKTART